MITAQIKRLREQAELFREKQHYITTYLDEAADTIEQLAAKVRAENGGGWIPVTERLPEENDYKSCYEVADGAVLWTNEDGLVGMGYYYESTKRWSDINDCPISVIAWMPLPDAYREDNDKLPEPYREDGDTE